MANDDGIKITEWTECRKNTLQGFATVEIPKWSFRFIGILVHEKNGKRWIALPAAARVKDNQLVLQDNGKPRYDQMFAFIDARVQARFAQAVLAALSSRLDAMVAGEAEAGAAAPTT